MIDVDEPDESDDDPPADWFSARTEAGVVPALPRPAIDREPKTIPNPVVGDMAAAFAQGKVKGREDGIRTGIKLALQALRAVLVDAWGDKDPTIGRTVARVGTKINELQNSRNSAGDGSGNRNARGRPGE